MSHLAHLLKERDVPYFEKNELVEFVLAFFKARSWHYDAADLVNDLLRRMLVQYADDEGSYVQFRYRCLQEYFTARYLQDNPGTLAQLFEADGFVKSVREIDILTGLTRNPSKNSRSFDPQTDRNDDCSERGGCD